MMKFKVYIIVSISMFLTTSILSFGSFMGEEIERVRKDLMVRSMFDGRDLDDIPIDEVEDFYSSSDFLDRYEDANQAANKTLKWYVIANFSIQILIFILIVWICGRFVIYTVQKYEGNQE